MTNTQYKCVSLIGFSVFRINGVCHELHRFSQIRIFIMFRMFYILNSKKKFEQIRVIRGKPMQNVKIFKNFPFKQNFYSTNRFKDQFP
jgi:hypothetical protein